MAKRISVGVAVGVCVALAAGLALSGCQPDFMRNSFVDERTESGRVTEIQVQGGSGSIVVQRATSTSEPVTIKRKVSYDDEKPERRYDQLDGSTLKLDSFCGERCGIDYTVTVPEAVKVTGRISSGSIRLTGVTSVVVATGAGAVVIADVAEGVVAETGSGEVSLTDVKGAVTAQTASGLVRLNRVGGPVTAETGSGEVFATGLAGERTVLRSGSGDVTIALTNAQDVTARTSSGDLLLTVPSGGSYRVKTNADSGKKNVSIVSDPNGRFALDLTSGSGDITVTTG